MGCRARRTRARRCRRRSTSSSSTPRRGARGRTRRRARDGASRPEHRPAGPARCSLGAVIEDLVEQIESRFAELGEQMTDPAVISDRARYADVGRAYRQLEPAAKLAEGWRLARDDASGAEELIAELGEDAELRAELQGARERIEQVEEEIRLAMVERDP